MTDHFTSEHASKRRKIESNASSVNVSLMGTQVRPDGTMTPIQDAHSQDADNEEMEVCSLEEAEVIARPSHCSCGYLHGPGTNIHDTTAVGFSVNMMRGPD